jgi:hypothetical protein
MIKPASSARDLSGVFAVELRKQAHDDTPSQQRASRGLEDEDSGDLSTTTQEEIAPEEIPLEAHPKVSFFA